MASSASLDKRVRNLLMVVCLPTKVNASLMHEKRQSPTSWFFIRGFVIAYIFYLFILVYVVARTPWNKVHTEWIKLWRLLIYQLLQEPMPVLVEAPVML